MQSKPEVEIAVKAQKLETMSLHMLDPKWNAITCPLAFLSLAILILLGANIAAQDTRDTKTFTGEIMDSQCAAYGSHDSMMDKIHAKNAKECAQACERAGAKYVLLTRSANAIYQLDDQIKADPFAGQVVLITGTYDAASKTIHVTDIAPAKFVQ